MARFSSVPEDEIPADAHDTVHRLQVYNVQDHQPASKLQVIC